MNTGSDISCIILDGKKTAGTIRQELAEKVKRAVQSGKQPPHLGAILVGDDGASQTYVNGKIKACEEAGFKSSLLRLPDTTSEKELLSHINKWNNDPEIHGFIVQLPLPGHISSQRVIEAVDPEKDVDGFHPVNAGKLSLGLPCFVPATPMGIMTLLERYRIETKGKHAVVIGRSNIVGTPVTLLLSRDTDPGNCTVTLTHSKTRDLKSITLQADVLVVALGRPGFVRADMVKPGAVVIDVGITRVKDESKKSGFRLQGDVNYDEVAPLASAITPVPGGVGPMTIASLLLNTYRAWEIQS